MDPTSVAGTGTRILQTDVPGGTQAARSPSPLRAVALIGSQPPRRCGIATFTADLAQALAESPSRPKVGVVASNDRSESLAYPSTVAFEIQQNQLKDYRVAADHINADRFDAVYVEHEYGIFGGRDGAHVLKLLGRLRMPVVTTLHTVRKQPSPG